MDGERGQRRVRRVLVVDNDKDSASVLALLLQSDGHDVRTAADGASALEEARVFQPELVILDIGMRGMSGYDVARELRRREVSAGGAACEGPALVALTGYADDESRRRCRDAGFDSHLVKPIQDFPAMRELVHTLAGRALAR